MSERIVPIHVHLAYKWKPTPLPIPPTLLAAEEALGVRRGPARAFKFVRRKRGTEVWLVFGGGFNGCGVHLNLSVQLDVWPKSFRDARMWAIEFARRHSIPAREIRRTTAGSSKAASRVEGNHHESQTETL